METSIQTIGYITKEEDLQILDFNIIEGTTVLETFEPFPGYHREIEQSIFPRSVFFILKTPLYREKTARIYKKMKKNLKFIFQISMTKIILNNQVYDAIRVLNINEYRNILELQKELLADGVVFYKNSIKPGTAIIKTYKQFELTEIKTDLFISNRNNLFSYFIIPKKISWDNFKEITTKIKNSWNLVSFDAAIGIIYTKNEVFDVVRIFSNHRGHSDLQKIQEIYLEKIQIKS